MPDTGNTLRARSRRLLTALAWWLAALYALDRTLKLLAVHRFLRRPHPTAPATWPSVTLLQPITRGASDLPTALTRRAALAYPGQLQHILICDAGDDTTISVCRAWLAAHPDLPAGQYLNIDTKRRVHPTLGPIEFQLRGATIRRTSAPQMLWHFDKAAALARDLDGEARTRFTALLRRVCGEQAMAIRLARPIGRQDYVLALV